MHPPTTFPPRPTEPRPWTPMADPHWHALAPFVTHRIGRPPRDPRLRWDAIFYVACSDRPWAALPRWLGNPGTAHSTLIHAARTGVLDRLLLAVSRHPFASEEMAPLEWRVVRAVRRASRQLGPATLLLARSLGLVSALYCDPAELPAPEPPDAPPPGVPPRAPGLDRLPYIPRRVLRGLPPPRGIARPPRPAPEQAPPAPRRPGQRPRRSRQGRAG
jgi:transposase